MRPCPKRTLPSCVDVVPGSLAASLLDHLVQMVKSTPALRIQQQTIQPSLP